MIYFLTLHCKVSWYLVQLSRVLLGDSDRLRGSDAVIVMMSSPHVIIDGSGHNGPI